jgi:hypothetical protein
VRGLARPPGKLKQAPQSWSWVKAMPIMEPIAISSPQARAVATDSAWQYR